MNNQDLNRLIGLKITSAVINETNDVIELTVVQDTVVDALSQDEGNLYITFEGECCAKCYVYHVNGAENLVGATITNAETTSWITNPEPDPPAYEVIETMGLMLTTTKGYVAFETRLEHNGYYGGALVITRGSVQDVYSLRYDDEIYKFRELKDF